MSSFPVGWLTRPVDLALFTQDDAVLSDAAIAECRLFTGEYDEDPEWVDATPHAADTGVYPAVDSDGNLLEFDSEIADGRVEWRYKIVEDDAWEYVTRHFEVLKAGITSVPVHNIFRVADVRSVEALESHSDRAIFEIARFWTTRIELYTRQKFWPDYRDLKFRVVCPLIQPPLEFFAVGSVLIESSKVEIIDAFTYMNTHRYGNPSIEVDERGSKTARIKAVWGLVDPLTMSAPVDLAMTAEKVATLVESLEGSGEIPAFAVGPMRREKTDAHEVEYSSVSTMVKSGMLALLRSPELRDQLDLYRAPIGIAMVGV
jgi:hypothetical protein